MKRIPLLILIFGIIIGIFVINFIQKQNTKNSKEQTGSNSSKQNIPLIPSTSSQLSPTPSKTALVSNEINLVIMSPESGVNVTTSTVTINGSTEPGASVSVNDQEVVANKDGSFKVSIALDEGENYISIVAYNDQGNVSERELLVTRNVTGL